MNVFSHKNPFVFGALSLIGAFAITAVAHADGGPSNQKDEIHFDSNQLISKKDVVVEMNALCGTMENGTYDFTITTRSKNVESLVDVEKRFSKDSNAVESILANQEFAKSKPLHFSGKRGDFFEINVYALAQDPEARFGFYLESSTGQKSYYEMNLNSKPGIYDLFLSLEGNCN